MRMLGATRRKLGSVVLMEAFISSFYGAVLGILFAAVVVFPFGHSIGVKIGMPLLLPSVPKSLLLLLFAFSFSVMVGPLSTAYSALIISRSETYETMREGE